MINNHRITLFALVFSGVYFLAVFVFGYEIFELVTTGLAALEKSNADEFIIPATAVCLAALTDAVRRRKIDAIEVEKAKVYRAMVFSVHHVLNNFLNQMRLFKMTADRTPKFDAEILALYDRVIQDTVMQIQALSTLSRIDEKTIMKSVAPGSHAKPGA